MAKKTDSKKERLTKVREGRLSTPTDLTEEATALLRDLIRNACVNDGNVASGEEIRSSRGFIEVAPRFEVVDTVLDCFQGELARLDGGVHIDVLPLFNIEPCG